MLLSGHNPDLLAAISTLACAWGIARTGNPFNYQRKLESTIRRSHGIATRASLPIDIGLPGRPPRTNFLRLHRLVVSGHYSFPRSDTTDNLNISEQVLGDYNRRVGLDCVEVAKSRTKDGYTLWSLAQNAGPDKPGKDEHEGKTVTRMVDRPTIGLIIRMGVALKPVYTAMGKDGRPTIVELGKTIPAKEVKRTTLHDISARQAAFRREHGEEDVYYAGELTAA